MANRDILAIGTSAGGVSALRSLVREFSSDFPAAVLITIHLSPEHRSGLDTILSQAGPLAATFATDDQPMERGRIYIAPPERHLLPEGDRLRLGTGPRENHARPAIDPMFRAIALCCGSRAVGVVLTGMLGDGASGLWALKSCGGISVVQDPSDAAFPSMPQTALRRTEPDHVAPLAEMPALLERLVRLPAGKPVPAPQRIKFEVAIARDGRSDMDTMDRVGRRSVLACPDCNGVLWEIDEGDLVRFRCHIGHAYTADRMTLALDENVQRALATALRVLEERIVLSRKIHDEETSAGRSPHLRRTLARRIHELEHEAEALRASIGRIDTIAAAE